MIAYNNPLYPLYLWTQKALPMVLAGDLTIVDLLNRLVKEIDEISGGSVDIDYETIINDLIQDETFYNMFRNVINQFLDGVTTGLGNLIGYYGSTQQRSVGLVSALTSGDPTMTFNAYRSDTMVDTQCDFKIGCINIFGVIHMSCELGRNMTVSLPNVPLSLLAQTTSQTVAETFVKAWSPDPDKDCVVFGMPYGSNSQYWYLVIHALTNITYGSFFAPFSLRTTGSAFNSIARAIGEASNFGYVTFVNAWLSNSNNYHLQVCNGGLWPIGEVVNLPANT